MNRTRKEITTFVCWFVPLIALVLGTGFTKPKEVNVGEMPDIGTELTDKELVNSLDEKEVQEDQTNARNTHSESDQANNQQSKPDGDSPIKQNTNTVVTPNQVEQNIRPVEEMAKQEIDRQIQQYQKTLKKGKTRLVIHQTASSCVRKLRRLQQTSCQVALSDDRQAGLAAGQSAFGHGFKHALPARPVLSTLRLDPVKLTDF